MRSGHFSLWGNINYEEVEKAPVSLFKETKIGDWMVVLIIIALFTEAMA